MDRNQKLRNGCAIVAILVYVIVNLIGIFVLQPLTPFAYHNGFLIVRIILPILGLIIIASYIAFCCFGARARGASSGMGALVAALGIVVWIGSAVVVLYQNVNNGFNIVDNAPRVYDNRLPWIAPIVFAISAVVLRMLPVKTPAAARETSSLAGN